MGDAVESVTFPSSTVAAAVGASVAVALFPLPALLLLSTAAAEGAAVGAAVTARAGVVGPGVSGSTGGAVGTGVTGAGVGGAGGVSGAGVVVAAPPHTRSSVEAGVASTGRSAEVGLFPKSNS